MNNTSYTPGDFQRFIGSVSVDLAVGLSAFFVVIWTTISNSIIVLCFVVNWRTSWPNFCSQVLCLSVSDMFVGYAALPLAVTGLTDVQMNIKICLIIYFLFFATQCASLYHILGICIYRLVVIRNSAKLQQENSTFRASLLLSGNAWVVSVLVCLSLTIVLGDPDKEDNICVMDGVFKDMRDVGAFFFVVFIIPQVSTNVLYALVCLQLKGTWNRVSPTSSNSISSSLEVQRSTAIRRSAVRVQKKVLVTVGLIMLIFNICTIHQIILFRIGEVKHQDAKRNVRFIVSTIFILNSAINPFVYALRNDWLKVALLKMLKDCARKLRP